MNFYYYFVVVDNSHARISIAWKRGEHSRFHHASFFAGREPISRNFQEHLAEHYQLGCRRSPSQHNIKAVLEIIQNMDVGEVRLEKRACHIAEATEVDGKVWRPGDLIVGDKQANIKLLRRNAK